ncbi:MAG: hypothetical protein RL732_1345, partial [Bacteroidota bacterium]
MNRFVYLTLLPLFLSCLTAVGQSDPIQYDFIENKGQWDPKIKFRANLPGGAFFITDSGFTVVQFRAEDLKQLHPPGNNQSVDDPRRERPSVRAHAYKVVFEKSASAPDIQMDQVKEFETNYLRGNNPNKWVRNVKRYGEVVIKNLYKGIDLRYYTKEGMLNYDFIVKPGGEVENISMKFTGAEKISLSKKNELLIKTSVGIAKELKPFTYTGMENSMVDQVDCRYLLDQEARRVKFQVGPYDRDKILVIDPALNLISPAPAPQALPTLNYYPAMIFSTLTGGGDNWGFTATPGPDESFFAGGIARDINYPVTDSAFKIDFDDQSGHTCDIGIIKFNNNGTKILYATYLGGSKSDLPHSMFCDPEGNLVVLGRTYSNSQSIVDYPGIMTGVEGSGNDCDIVVTKLNAKGDDIIGSLRIGGSSNDGVNINDNYITQTYKPRSLLRFYGDESRSEVVLDAQNNIYIAANTQSSSLLPNTLGTFNGEQDGLVMKINAECNAVIWSRYIGGPGNDGAFVLDINPLNGILFVGGATENSGSSFTGITPSAITGNNGGIDGFISILNPTTGALNKSVIVGTTKTDIIYGLKFDRKGFPYIMGVSDGIWPLYPTAPTVDIPDPIKRFTYRKDKEGYGQFIAKLQADLSNFVYSTTFGIEGKFLAPSISPVAFAVDNCENLYISGWGGNASGEAKNFNISSMIGLPIDDSTRNLNPRSFTAKFFKKATDNADFYFIKIEKNASRLGFAAYFGEIDPPGYYSGEHVDGGTSRFDKNGVIYQAICANCGSENIRPPLRFPTTNGVWSKGANDRYNPKIGLCNLAAVKINFNFRGISAGPAPQLMARGYKPGERINICVNTPITFVDTFKNAKLYQWAVFNDTIVTGIPDIITSYLPERSFTTSFPTTGLYTIRLIAKDPLSCNEFDTAYLPTRVGRNIATVRFTPQKTNPDCRDYTYSFINQSVDTSGSPIQSKFFTWNLGDGTLLTDTTEATFTHPFKRNPNNPEYKVSLMLNDTNYCNSPATTDTLLTIVDTIASKFKQTQLACYDPTGLGSGSY